MTESEYSLRKLQKIVQSSEKADYLVLASDTVLELTS